MFLIDKAKNRISEIEEKTFIDLGFKERENLQEWIVNNPTFFGEKLLIIQKEFDGFDDTRERLDIMALDESGNIVVIENKLDDTGRNVVWQVLKYSSYCASLSKIQIKTIFQQYLDKNGIPENAEEKLCDFFGKDDFKELELNPSQRIIMVAGNFRKEVTSTVLWLYNNYKLKIQCFKVTPYSMNDQLFLDLEQIIPVKEAEEYMIRMAEKKQDDSETQEELKTRYTIRTEFWKKLLEKVNKSGTHLYQNISPSKDNWINAGTGMSGVSLAFVISGTNCRTELVVSRGRTEENKFVFDELHAQKDKIQSDFGRELDWERGDNKKQAKIKYQMDGVSYFEKEDWNKMIDFLVDGMIRMERAFIKPVQQINLKIKKQVIE